MGNGWIKDYRQELNSDIWMMPPLYHRVWQWLKYQVNHEDQFIPLRNGSKVKVSKGQHMTSIRQIAQGVGWYEGRVWKEPNPKTIRTILKWLEQQGMITITAVRGNNGYTLITLINWEVYQSKEDRGNIVHPLEKQSTDINKNDKNDKEIIDDDDPVRDQSFWDDLKQEVEQGKGLANKPKSDYEKYFDQIEEYFNYKKGSYYPFSKPNDLEAIKRLFEIGISLQEVKKSIDYAFKQKKKINSFSYCAAIIFNRLEEREQQKKQKKVVPLNKHQQQAQMPKVFQPDFKPEEPERKVTEEEVREKIKRMMEVARARRIHP